VYGATWDCEGRDRIVLTSPNHLSGVIDGQRFYYLVGVFTTDTISDTRQPKSLDFTRRHNFKHLSPKLNQVFYIGDGRDTTGHLQVFRPPHGATRLYLGMPDLCGWPGPPSCYEDNGGTLEVKVALTSRS
jgi:hypothetical protein